jgi:hypothetical protein
MSNVREFEKAIKQFGIDAALEYFDVPEEKKDFFRVEIGKFRNLLRVVAVNDKKVIINIPGISTYNNFVIDKSEIPFDVVEGQRFHARMNLNAESEKELHLSDWEEK